MRTGEPARGLPLKETSVKKKSSILNSMLAAFASYSRIPVPGAEWDEQRIRWQICFFPMVGVVIGILWCAAGAVLTYIGTGPVLTGAVLTALPIFLTGGIHMDGFLDTSDAIHSWKSEEERMRILDDPHMGAFAFIYGSLYLIMYFGLSVQLAAALKAICSGNETFTVILRQMASVLVPAGSGFVISRVLSALAVLIFPKSKKKGTLKKTADTADSRNSTILKLELTILLVVYITSAVLLRQPGIAAFPASAVLFWYGYRQMAVNRFGGISGDLAGWFLVNCELIELAAAVIVLLIRGTAF